MDLLKTILIYMSMVFASSVQNAPQPSYLPDYLAPTPTPYVEVAATATPTPRPTPTYTPVPTIDITPNPAYGTFRVGDSGDEVRELQEKLAQYGYYAGDIDGRYGNQTRRAVEAFQYRHGLSPDGIAGRNTLTVLYESGEVRMAAAAETPAPTTTGRLSVAMTETPSPSTGATFTPVETITPQTSASPQASAGTTTAAAPSAPASAPNPTDTPAKTPAPTQTPAPEFLPMKGYTIQLAGASQPLAAQASEEGQASPLEPYKRGEELYLPLIEVIRGASMNVIVSTTADTNEFAFAINDEIIRVSYAEDQMGEPSALEAYKSNQPQILPSRDIRRVDGILYLPAVTVQSLTGITAETDEEGASVIVTIPAEKEGTEG